MSDLYSLLRQSMIDRDLRTPAERDEAYTQARTAMIRRLWSFDPPLAEDEIDARIGQFDLAVDRIEGDLAAIFSGRSPPAALPSRQGSMTVIDDLDAGYDSGFDDPEPDPDDPGAIRAAARKALDERSLIVEAALRGLALEPPPPPRRALPPARPADDFAANRRTDDRPRDDDRRRAPDDDDPYGEASAADERHRDEERYARRENEDYHEEERREDDRYREAERRREDERYAEPEENYERYEREPPRRDDHSLLSAPFEDEAEEPPPPPVRAKRKTPARKISALHILVGVVALLGVGLLGVLGYVFVPMIFGKSQGTVVATGGPGPGAAGGVVGTSTPVVTIFDGRDPTVFQADSNNPVRFNGDQANGFASISTSNSSPGASVVIGPGLSDRLAGRTVRVTITARTSKERGAASLRFAYQSGVAISHWVTATLAPDFKSYALEWRVPAMRTDESGDHVVIEPGIPGDGSSADVSAVRIEVVPG